VALFPSADDGAGIPSLVTRVLHSKVESVIYLLFGICVLGAAAGQAGLLESSRLGMISSSGCASSGWILKVSDKSWGLSSISRSCSVASMAAKDSFKLNMSACSFSINSVSFGGSAEASRGSSLTLSLSSQDLAGAFFFCLCSFPKSKDFGAGCPRSSGAFGHSAASTTLVTSWGTCAATISPSLEELWSQAATSALPEWSQTTISACPDWSHTTTSAFPERSQTNNSLSPECSRTNTWACHELSQTSTSASCLELEQKQVDGTLWELLERCMLSTLTRSSSCSSTSLGSSDLKQSSTTTFVDVCW